MYSLGTSGCPWNPWQSSTWRLISALSTTLNACLCILVGGLEHFLFFHILGIIIRLIFFRGVGIKPTSCVYIVTERRETKNLNRCSQQSCLGSTDDSWWSSVDANRNQVSSTLHTWSPRIDMFIYEERTRVLHAWRYGLWSSDRIWQEASSTRR